MDGPSRLVDVFSAHVVQVGIGRVGDWAAWASNSTPPLLPGALQRIRRSSTAGVQSASPRARMVTATAFAVSALSGVGVSLSAGLVSSVSRSWGGVVAVPEAFTDG
ncbi:hypothetical protein QLX52_28310 [Streptomyces albus]|uniref:hypothetical protein n=1 Tax=Streptomyces TaxID=1883 RepID=UPI001CED5C2E|nr:MULTISPECIES: hypothetical protein [Streptomyces]MDI6412712.1 hypothetical protein [Streptomyces albus]